MKNVAAGVSPSGSTIESRETVGTVLITPDGNMPYSTAGETPATTCSDLLDSSNALLFRCRQLGAIFFHR
jgi:hypothetical protein